jgi:hypothetical protein
VSSFWNQESGPVDLEHRATAVVDQREQTLLVDCMQRYAFSELCPVASFEQMRRSE